MILVHEAASAGVILERIKGLWCIKGLLQRGIAFTGILILFTGLNIVDALIRKDVHFVPGAFGGPSLEKACIANAIAIAVRKKWKLVLPDFRFDYGDPQYTFVEPFDFMYNISALNALSSHGLSIVTVLPKRSHHACLIELQHSLQHVVHPTMESLDTWADQLGVVCLHDTKCIEYPWMQNSMNDSLIGDIRMALQPSLQFKEEIQLVLSNIVAKVKSYSFDALHALIDDDWCKHCSPETLKHEKCCVNEGHMLNFLEHVVHLKSSSHLYIGAGVRRGQLPLICSVYQCFNREDVWQPQMSLIPHADQQLVKSYMDVLIMELARKFIGNKFSQTSMDLFHYFRKAGKSAVFVNVSPAESQTI